MTMPARVSQRLGARAALAGVGVLIGVALVILAVAMSRGIGGAETGVREAGFDVAPDFTLTSFDGETVALADLGDRPLFIYFWADWCFPCHQEAPVIQQMWPEYEARGYLFIGINTLDREDTARSFIDQHGLTFTLVRDEARTVYLDYGVARLPEAFFFHPGFALETRFSGALTEEDLRTHLEAIGPGGESS